MRFGEICDMKNPLQSTTNNFRQQSNHYPSLDVLQFEVSLKQPKKTQEKLKSLKTDASSH